MATWNVTCNRFVGFFDIMGFKDMVLRNNHEDVLQKINQIREAIGVIENYGKELLNSKADTHRTGKPHSYADAIVLPVFFSDSIVLVSEDDSKASARKIVMLAAWLMYKSLINGLPIKGAIAYGEQTADFEESLHVGRPLIDAYILQEELHMYGAVLHHSMEAYLKENDMVSYINEKKRFLCRGQVPLKECNVVHYCVDWPGVFRFYHQDPVATVSGLAGNVSGSVRLYVDNTLRFVKKVEAISVKKDPSPEPVKRKMVDILGLKFGSQVYGKG